MILPYNSGCTITQSYSSGTHNGIDIVGTGDKNIYSVVSGVVGASTIIYDKTNKTWEWGNYVRVDTTDGNSVYYCHMSERSLSVGDIVSVGTKVGVEGNTGYSFGSHLHIESRKTAYNTPFDVSEIMGIKNQTGTPQERETPSPSPYTSAITIANSGSYFSGFDDKGRQFDLPIYVTDDNFINGTTPHISSANYETGMPLSYIKIGHELPSSEHKINFFQLSNGNCLKYEILDSQSIRLYYSINDVDTVLLHSTFMSGLKWLYLRAYVIQYNNRYYLSTEVLSKNTSDPNIENTSRQIVNFNFSGESGRYSTGNTTLYTDNFDIFFFGKENPPSVEKYGGDPTSEQGGDGGNYDNTSDDIDFPDDPATTAVASGFVGLYVPTVAELRSLAGEMWVDTIAEQLRNFLGDITDVVIGLSAYPFNVPHIATKNAVKLGFISTQTQMSKATSEFVTIDCGTLDLREYWGSYLDYAPSTKVQLYLPFISFVELDADEVMNSTLHLKYKVNIFTGSCLAMLKVTKTNRISKQTNSSVLYQWGGNCATPIPICARDFSGLAQAMVGAVSSTIRGGMSGGVGGAVLGGLESVANSVVSGACKPTVHHGATSGASGNLSIRTPFVVITRPRHCNPENIKDMTGYPSYINMPLSQLTGYTEVLKIHLDNISATDEEIKEIEEILKKGVIL